MKEYIVRCENNKFTIKGKIVRCKDCRHCADDWNGNQPMFTCELARCCESVYPDDYCSYGEKQVTSKLNNPDDSLVTDDSEACKEQKSKLESEKVQLSPETSIWSKGMSPFGVLDDGETSTNKGETATTSKTETVDLISRYAAISIPILPKEARKKFKDYDDAFETGWLEALECVNMLPPIEPPKKVVAQIKVDTDEIVERIKEEYEIKERPKGECRTCKRCSDHCCETDDDFTRCPIEEHYMLPKDGYCHLYDPIWR